MAVRQTRRGSSSYPSSPPISPTPFQVVLPSNATAECSMQEVLKLIEKEQDLKNEAAELREAARKTRLRFDEAAKLISMVNSEDMSPTERAEAISKVKALLPQATPKTQAASRARSPTQGQSPQSRVRRQSHIQVPGAKSPTNPNPKAKSRAEASSAPSEQEKYDDVPRLDKAVSEVNHCLILAQKKELEATLIRQKITELQSDVQATADSIAKLEAGDAVSITEGPNGLLVSKSADSSTMASSVVGLSEGNFPFDVTLPSPTMAHDGQERQRTIEATADHQLVGKKLAEATEKSSEGEKDDRCSPIPNSGQEKADQLQTLLHDQIVAQQHVIEKLEQEKEEHQRQMVNMEEERRQAIEALQQRINGLLRNAQHQITAFQKEEEARREAEELEEARNKASGDQAMHSVEEVIQAVNDVLRMDVKAAVLGNTTSELSQQRCLRIGYIGSPANLQNAAISEILHTLFNRLKRNGHQLYVGPPNSALEHDGVKVQDMNDAAVDMFDIVLITPGGPGALKEAQRFDGHTTLFTFINSSDERFGSPAWMKDLDAAKTFDFKAMARGKAARYEEARKKDEDAEDLSRRIHERASVAQLILGMSFKPLQMIPSKKRKSVDVQHADDVMSVSFSADGCSFVSAGEDEKVCLWEARSQSKKMEVTMHGAVLAVAYCPSGEYLAAGDVENFVCVWSSSSFEEKGQATVDGQVLSLAMVSKPHGLIAVGTNTQKVILMSVPTLEELTDFLLDGDVRSVCFSPCGQKLAGGSGTDDMHGLMTKKVTLGGRGMKTVIWQVSRRPQECKHLRSILFGDIVHAVAWAPSGKILAVGGENRMIAMLLVDREFDKVSQLACAAGVRCLSWSSESRFLASAGEDMQISVWDVMKERIVFQLPKRTDWYSSISFSPHSDWIAGCGFSSNMVTLHPVEIFEEGLPGADESMSEDEKAPSEIAPISISLPVMAKPTAAEEEAEARRKAEEEESFKNAALEEARRKAAEEVEARRQAEAEEAARTQAKHMQTIEDQLQRLGALENETAEQQRTIQRLQQEKAEQSCHMQRLDQAQAVQQHTIKDQQQRINDLLLNVAELHTSLKMLELENAQQSCKIQRLEHEKAERTEDREAIEVLQQKMDNLLRENSDH